MQKRTLEPFLKEHPFFQDLPSRYLELVVGCATNVVFSSETHIFRENDVANKFYLIREGSVALRIPAPRGSIVVETLHSGDVLGWSWLFEPYRWQFNALTLSRTRAIALDGKCIRKKCEEDHELGYELMKRFGRLMVSRLQSTRLQLLDIYGDPMVGKK